MDLWLISSLNDSFPRFFFDKDCMEFIGTMRWYFRMIIQTKEDKLLLFKGRKQDLVKSDLIEYE